VRRGNSGILNIPARPQHKKCDNVRASRVRRLPVTAVSKAFLHWTLPPETLGFRTLSLWPRGIAMTRMALTSASMAVCIVFGFSTAGKATELGAPRARVVEALPPHCDGTQPCRPISCSPGHRCKPHCPDGYSCYPLYGGYGPYGGGAYWDAYTGGGWEYRTW